MSTAELLDDGDLRPSVADEWSRVTGKPSIDDVAAWLKLLLGDGQGIEIRAPKAGPRRDSNIVRRFEPGHFKAAAHEALKLSGKAPAVYVVMNGIDPDLPTKGKLGGGAKAGDIPRRRWLLVDLDPDRIVEVGESTEVNSTRGEKFRALERTDSVRGLLEANGWPAPIVADSGNGGHLLYRLDLPNDDASTDLIKKILFNLGDLWDDPDVKVDRRVHDAPRLVKLYGTEACKGVATEERPARSSRVLIIPEVIEVVSQEKLEALASISPPAPDDHLQGVPGAASPPTRSQFTAVRTGRATIEDRACAYLAKCDPSISGSNGHTAAFKAAKIGPGFNLPPDVALRLMKVEFNPRCQPPWSERELQHKVDEAYKVESHRGWLLDAALPQRSSTPRLRVVREARAGEKGPQGSSVGFVGTQTQASDAHSGAETAPGDSFVGSVGTNSQASVEFLPDLRPLRGDLLEVPKLDPRMLPGDLRAWLEDIADRGCFPIEYSAAGALVGLAAMLGRKLAIRPKKYDTWTVIPNLWGAIVGPPGIQKSPSLTAAMAPIRRIEAKANEAFELALKEAQEDAEIAELRAGSAKANLKKKAGSASDAELRILLAQSKVETKELPTRKRVLQGDATVEKLGENLKENPNGLMVYRDELMGFLRSLERQGHEGDRAFYLEGWNGDQDFVFDRIGRGTIHIPNICISLLGSIQPGPLARYISNSTAKDGEDGFIPRFQVMLFPDPPTTFVDIDENEDVGAKNRAHAIYEWINRFDAGALGAEWDEDRAIHFIHFDDEAQPLFKAWREELEVTLRTNVESPLITAHLSKYRSLMPALALIFHVADSVGKDRIGPVPADKAKLAFAWCDLLLSHARRVYQSSSDGDIEGAARLGDRLKQSLPNPFTFRQVANKGWSGLDSVDDVRKVVGVLEDRGWVKVVQEQNPAGGRPSEKVYVNPAVFEQKEGKQ
jgi:hypothetical protein